MGGGHQPKKVCLPNLSSFLVLLLLYRALFISYKKQKTNDDSHIVLTADKGAILVIMHKDIHIEKCIALLNDEEI